MRLRHVVIGALTEIGPSVERGWPGRASAAIPHGLSRAGDFVRGKLEDSDRLGRWEKRGREVERGWRLFGQRFAENALGDLLGALRRTPSTWSFVDAIVRHLIGNPDLRDLVDDIVAYLVNHPMVLTLIQQQSLGFTDEVVGTARARLTEADGIVDRVVASIRGSFHRSRPLGASSR